MEEKENFVNLGGRLDTSLALFVGLYTLLGSLLDGDLTLTNYGGQHMSMERVSC